MNNVLTSLTTKPHRRAAWVISLLILASLCIIGYFAPRVLPQVTPFLPAYAAIVMLTEGLTAYLLMVQFSIARVPAIGLVGSAYLYTAIIVVIQLMVFPGVFAPTGLLGAGPQSAVWLWVFWHGGFPSIIIVAGIVHRFVLSAPMPVRHGKAAGIAMVVLPVVLALGLANLAVFHSDWLPVLIKGTDYRQLLTNPVAIVVWVLNLLALFLIWMATRMRTMLSLWLGVAVLASVVDVSLTLLAANRYSVGWYGGRLVSIASSAVVLGALLWEINHLYRELARVNFALFESVQRDGLTGIFNRRYLDSQLPIEIARGRRQREPVSVMMIDVDHFKQFNDRFGHQKGDQCLTLVADTLRRQVKRPGDFVARYGGEEFAAVLPNTDPRGAVRLAELVCKAVADIDPALTGASITVSIGVACSEADTDCMQLIAAADSALYQAKKEGRNRVAYLADSVAMDETLQQASRLS